MKNKFEEKYRLNYHLMPIKGLMNDPNGLLYRDGKYYVFYQLNDEDCTHRNKKWGLYTTDDFVNWKIENTVLEPDRWYDKDGCYSGSGILVDGRINLFYTGNVKNDGKRESYQCRVVEKEDGNFEKLGPVINEIPQGYTAHFRDPKVWRDSSGKYFMVLGAQSEEEKGEVLLYSSENLETWNFEGSLYNKGELGYMLECPDLFNLNGEDIMLVCPQGLDAKGDFYNNIYQSGYMFGKFDIEKVKFEEENFIELDRGFDFYAPQTFVDGKNRRILIGWMGLPEMEEGVPSIEEGWIHALTIPRELCVKNERLIQKPLEEMKKLRGEGTSYENIMLKETLHLDDVNGSVFEMIVDFENIDSKNFGIKIRKKGEKELLIKISEGKLLVDRNRTDFLDGKRACKIEGEKHRLHIFSDTSSVEVFYNDGEEVFTSRIYTDIHNDEIEFFSFDGKVKINKIEFYKINSMNYRE
jgi:beta-fructofuranosidase